MIHGYSEWHLPASFLLFLLCIFVGFNMNNTPPEVLEKWRSALSEVSYRVEIVDESNVHEYIDFMMEMVYAMPDPIELELPFDGPQRTYSGPPMKGKKGKNRRW